MPALAKRAERPGKGRRQRISDVVAVGVDVRLSNVDCVDDHAQRPIAVEQVHQELVLIEIEQRTGGDGRALLSRTDAPAPGRAVESGPRQHDAGTYTYT